MQGMITNDTRPLEKPGAGPVYAALLTPKGKFLHDLFLHQEQGTPGSFLMEVDASGKQRALDWLTRYKLKRAVTLEDLSGQHAVWALYGPGLPAAAPQGWSADPRLPELGYRAVFPAASSPQPSLAASALQEGGEELYRAWRYRHGVAEGESEIPTDKAAPLDYNLDVLNGVSYKKGCYIGQERNSFTHYRGVIRKRCAPFTTPHTQQGAPAPGVGEEIYADGAATAPVGTVRGAAGGYGIAYLQLAHAIAAEQGRVVLRTKNGVVVQPFRPAWWPREWGHEEDAAVGAGPEAAGAVGGTQPV